MVSAIFDFCRWLAERLGHWLDLDFYEFGLVVIFFGFALIVYRLHRTDDSEFRFEDFFTHGDQAGKASVFRLLVFGAWMIHSWVIVRQEVFGHLPETALALYASIWSGSYLVLRGLQAKEGQTNVQGTSAGATGSGGASTGGADGHAR